MNAVSKIWVKPEPRDKPYIPCYTPRVVAIAEARVQRDAAERSKFKKYFSIKYILIGFYSIFINLFFILDFGQRGIKGVPVPSDDGECPKSKTPYFNSLSNFLKPAVLTK